MSKISVIFSIIAIVIAVFVFQQIFSKDLSIFRVFEDFYLGPFSKKSDVGDKNDIENDFTDISGNGISDETEEEFDPSRPQTFITSGPGEGEFVKDEPVIAFKFVSEWEDLDDISFEVRVIGLDEQWKSVSSNSYSFKILSGDNNYTFQVRAKTKEGVYDLTPAQRNFRTILSQYMGKVKFITARAGSFPNRIMEIVLRNEGEDVNITDWKISGTKGIFGIPRAIRILNPDFPLNTPSDLIFKSGERVNIFGNISSISANFLLNKCTGYLNNIYDFNPELPNDCDRIEEDEIRSFSYDCRKYISGLSRCEAPDPNILNQFVSDSPCKNFANERLNYRGCFYHYNQMNDFFDDEWNLYSTTNFLAEHDDLELRDKEGLLVDRFNF